MFLLAACDGGLWNNPYPSDDAGKSIFYTAFTGRPKHFDPVQAYSENEYEFLSQIYQPPLEYHYLKRASWGSREEFIAHVLASASEYNQLYAHPFEWTWTNQKMRQWFAKHAP